MLRADYPASVFNLVGDTPLLGNDKPRSRSEATGMAMVLMRRWIEINGGGYDERDRGSRSGLDDWAIFWPFMIEREKIELSLNW